MQASATSCTEDDAAPPGILSYLVGIATAIVFPLDVVFRSLAGAGLSLDALCAYLGITRHAVFEHIVRLGLPTPADTPLRKPSAKGWTVEDIHRLIAWRSTGVHPETIGQSLSRSRSANAVRAKARRLGLAAPSRKHLFRPPPEQLALPLPSDPAAERVSERRNGMRVAPGVSSPGRQPLLGLTPQVIPASIEELDLRDLSWVGALRGRRGRPGDALQGITTNRAAAYAVGIVTCAGVDRHVAAEILGLTVASYRTHRTRLGLPPVAERSAFTNLFDIEVGEETIKRSGLEIVASMRRTDGQPPQFFWRYRDERHVRLAPSERPQRSRGEPTFCKPITIVTRAVLDAEVRHCGRKPASGATVMNPVSAMPTMRGTQVVQLRPSRREGAAIPTPRVPIPSALFATAHASVER